jgi:hypothetical protein
MSHRAQIKGKVEYRQGDGVNMTIPLGPCEVDESPGDATISWSEGESRGSAAMPATAYRRYVAKKAIVLDGAMAG